MHVIPRIFESQIYTQVLTSEAGFLFIPIVPLMCLFAAKKAGECIDLKNSTMHHNMQEIRSHDLKKKLGLLGEETTDHWIREDLSRRPRKPLNPCPILTQGTITRVNAGQDLPFVLWRGDRRGDFLTPATHWTGIISVLVKKCWWPRGLVGLTHWVRILFSSWWGNHAQIAVKCSKLMLGLYLSVPCFFLLFFVVIPFTKNLRTFGKFNSMSCWHVDPYLLGPHANENEVVIIS